MSLWRILLLAETTSVGMLIAQVVAWPLFILAAFTSGSTGAIFALELFVVLPGVLYICNKYVGTFKTIAPEGTLGLARLLSYAGHAVGVIGMWQFFYIKVIILAGPFAGSKALILTSPEGDLVLSFFALVLGLIMVRQHSRVEIPASAK